MSAAMIPPHETAADLIAPLRQTANEAVETVASLLDRLVAVAYAERERANFLSEALRSAEADVEAARIELLAVRAQCQEIVDTQALQMIELKRQLEAAEAARHVVPARAVVALPPPEPIAAGVVPDELRTSPLRRRHDQPLELDAIEAALAASPPAAVWPRVAV
jgi:hypothetical protein